MQSAHYRPSKKPKIKEALLLWAEAGRQQRYCTGVQKRKGDPPGSHCSSCGGRHELTPETLFDGSVTEFAHWSHSPRNGDERLKIYHFMRAGHSKQKVLAFLKTGRFLHRGCHRLETQHQDDSDSDTVDQLN